MQIELLLKMLAAFATAFIIAAASTPLIKLIAPKIGAVDVPKDSRRMHKKPMPLCGGLAIFIAFSAASFIFVPLTAEFWGIWLGALLIIVLGVLDDIFSLNAYVKLAGQVAVSVIPVFFGVYIKEINIFGIHIETGFAGIILSVIWIVVLTNAFNLIDGLDGLACGVSAISAVAVFAVGLILKNPALAFVGAVLFGSTAGFLPYNFNPAKIFMGDTGAMFLGYIFAVAAVFGVYSAPSEVSVAVPFVIYGLPIFDTTFAFMRRILSGKSPFSADRGHLHHKLIDRGLNQKQAVLCLYSVSMLLSISAVIICIVPPVARIILTVAVIIALTVLSLILEKNRTKAE